jgi:hypothetical protein
MRRLKAERKPSSTPDERNRGPLSIQEAQLPGLRSGRGILLARAVASNAKVVTRGGIAVPYPPKRPSAWSRRNPAGHQPDGLCTSTNLRPPSRPFQLRTKLPELAEAELVNGRFDSVSDHSQTDPAESSENYEAAP